MISGTERLTTAQAIVRFLARQQVERDGNVNDFFGGVTGIFGHGNLAGMGQALLQYQDVVPYYQARNEQGMVHMATGYAKARNRLAALACTSSIGPGATNMVTGAATATINRLPVLLLPGDIFATRRAGSVLQQLETGWSQDVSVNDAFKPVSRYWDRINRPEQLVDALLAAMRVLTSPAETGAVTLALPQDVQAEAWDFPSELFEPRVWSIPRARPDESAIAAAVAVIREAERPLIIAGGGAIYSEATAQLQEFAHRHGIPVGETQAGKGALSFDDPYSLGAIGVSGSAQANDLAREADVVIGIGTRYTDFTTASRTLFAADPVFVNLNVAESDAGKNSAVMLTGDAREGLRELSAGLAEWTAASAHSERARDHADQWRAEVRSLREPRSGTLLPAQSEVIAAVNESSAPADVVVCAAGSLPGDLHRLWQSRDPKGYHMEYGYSCMGYEVAGALGAKLGDPSREVYALVGDGSWLMLSSEVVTAVQEGIKLIVVLVNNHGFGSIAALSESLGSQAFGTRFRFRDADGRLAGENLPIDFTANAASLGMATMEARTRAELEAALQEARASDQATFIHVEVDPQARFGGSGAWWDVPVSEASEVPSTSEAREEYERQAVEQRHYLRGVRQRAAARPDEHVV